jgi:SAM-dependent methyltransferase/uncharacterized protein YbaR (Trm112 family)
VWCCPTCRGTLTDDTDSLRCEPCNACYPIIGGIPDLRDPSLLQPRHLADRDRARSLADGSRGQDLTALIAGYFMTRKYWTPAMAEKRVRRTLEAPQQMRSEVRGWLGPATQTAAQSERPFLDLGCGLGGLLSAAALEGRHGIGIDQSLHLLVGARRVIEANGGCPVLAAAFGERLPLGDRSIGGIVMQDVFEHVDSKAVVLDEAGRVLAPGGILALCVPNRFSVAAEPHVGIWGVGWLPRHVQQAYVRWRTDDPYENIVLPSVWELQRLLRRHAPNLVAMLDPAPIPDQEIEHFGLRRAGLARAYNRLLRNSFVRSIQLRFGPSIRLVAQSRQ